MNDEMISRFMLLQEERKYFHGGTKSLLELDLNFLTTKRNFNLNSNLLFFFFENKNRVFNVETKTEFPEIYWAQLFKKQKQNKKSGYFIFISFLLFSSFIKFHISQKKKKKS